MIIAAVGKNASGKDYFLKYLSDKYEIPMISIGDIARELATKEGVEHTRENLHLISNKYMSKYGQTFFPEQVAIKIKESKFKNVLVSGIRPLSDVITLKKEFGTKFILIDIVVTDDKIRYERMQKRASARDPQSYDKFLEYDAGEEKLFQTSETEAMSDYKVINDGDEKEFHEQIDNFYEDKLKALLD